MARTHRAAAIAARTTATRVAIATLGTVAALLASLRAGWVGDLIGLAMPVVLAVSCIATMFLLPRRAAWAVVPAAALLVSAGMVFVPRWPVHTGAPARPIRIAAVNLLWDSKDPAGGVESALAAAADVLVVSELTGATDALLRERYPNSVVTAGVRTKPYSEGVYSTLPLTELDPPADVAGQLLRVRVGGATPFVLYAAHLSRPTFTDPAPPAMIAFSGHRDSVIALDRDADRDGEQGPVVIAGDLNLSDRSSGYRLLSSGRLDVSRTGWAGSTFLGAAGGSWSLWSLLLLRIDHLLAPADWCATGAHSFGLAGSDHRGIAASIGPCR